MSKTKLPRRTFLRGTSTALVALPLLDVMLSSNGDCLAAGDPIPGRFVLMFGGGSVAPNDGNLGNIPTTQGAGWQSTTAFEPLISGGFKGDVSLITGLKAPITTNPGVGGAKVLDEQKAGFHSCCWIPQLNGATAIAVPDRSRQWQGATVDQVIAASIGSKTKFPSLFYQAQVKNYLDGNDHYGRNAISLRRSGGRIEMVQPQLSPSAAFRSLFNGVPPQRDVPVADDPNISRRSVLDHVLQDARRLWNNLGSADRQKLDQHMDAIRNLEMRLQAAPPPVSGGACRQPTNFPGDPGGGEGAIEIARTQLYNELTRLAFACDLTRTVSILISVAQSRMKIPGLGEIHENSHNTTTQKMGQITAWHLKNGYCDLLAKLKNTREGSGTLLDTSAVAYVQEGGFGQTNDAGGNYNKSPHSTENMIAILAGRVGGLMPGKHINYGNNQHPAKVMISAMNALGVGDRLNEIQGSLPELFKA